MNHLLRSQAPLSAAGWELLDEEARQRLTPALAARTLVDFSGPHGWERSATNLGRVDGLDGSPGKGVTGLRRRVLPFVELRADFELSRDELRAADRGADDVDLEPLDRAARQIAVAENRAVLRGWDDAVAGVAAASPHAEERLTNGTDGTVKPVAGAVERLRESGIGGPYGLALAPGHYLRVVETAEHGGYPLLEHLRAILDGPVVRAPGLEGAVVLSLRGGDFLFECGQDISIGYDSHDKDVVRLYLEESFSFHVATPEAGVVIDP